jgi:hypothetical protein
VQSLSKDVANLIEGETIINFVLNKIIQQRHNLSGEVFSAIKEKVSKRRNDPIVSLILYLSDSANLLTESHFHQSSVPVINKTAVKLMERIFGSTNDEEEIESRVDTVEEIAEEEKSLAQQLAEKVSSVKNSANNLRMSTDYKKEMNLYAKTKQRTHLLDRLLDALSTIQATSVTAERHFSEANNVITKNRSRLLDENIQATVFLKSFFKNKAK